MNLRTLFTLGVATLGLGLGVYFAAFPGEQALAADQVRVTFRGGHEIGEEDFGRPCNLMAAALGVKTEIFREAFSGVRPARGRGPTGDEARQNKQALMKVLAPHNVTNERMDEVANYYRYKPQDGELWPTADAKGYAVVENGKVKEIVITDPGHGYSSAPEVRIDGYADVQATATLGFSKEFKKNGTIKSVELASSRKREKKIAE